MNTHTNAGEEKRSYGPGPGAALVAFLIFAGIAAGSVAVAHRTGTLYDDTRTTGMISENSEGGRVEVSAVMRHVNHRSDTQAFRRAELVTIAGSSVLNLTGAQMQGEKGEIEIVVIAGSAFVKVPPDWAVVSVDSVAAGGAIDNRAKEGEGPSVKRVRLEAFVMGGRIDIRH